MSFLTDILNRLTESGNTAETDGVASQADHSCANCPGNCAIAPEACEACAPFKKKLIDTVYYVDHLDEFNARYEVTGLSDSGGSVICPYCGAPSGNAVICEYCGSRISDAAQKIRVANASDIPNPIMQAQDIIFERYEAIVKKYTQETPAPSGLLQELFAILAGSSSESAEKSALGAKMSEAEIREAAGLYGVSVSEYLTGLDNGKYLTLAGQKAAAAAGTSSISGQEDSFQSFTPAALGMSGMAGVGMLAGTLLSGRKKAPQTPPGPAPDPRHQPDGTMKRPQQPDVRDRQPAMSSSRGPGRPESGRPRQTDSRSGQQPAGGSRGPGGHGPGNAGPRRGRV